MKKVFTLKRLVSISYILFGLSFVFYAIADLLTSGQTYHVNPNRTTSYITLIIFILSLVVSIIIHFFELKNRGLLNMFLKTINPITFVSLFLLIVTEIISFLGNKTSFGELLRIAIYPCIFLLIYVLFTLFQINETYNNKIIFTIFLCFFVVYFVFFVFYFFYIQGKPTSGGGLRAPTLAHIFFLLTIFCFLRRFLTSKAKLILYCFYLPLLFCSGKLSVIIISGFIFLYDFINSEIFIYHHKLKILFIITISLCIAFVLVISNFSKNNFFADNFSFHALILSGRLENWNNILPNFKNFNFKNLIIGKGPGSTMLYNNGTAAHNDYIEFLFDYGIIGLLCYVTFISSFIVEAFRKRDNTRKELLILTMYIVIIGLISAVFTSMNILILCLLPYFPSFALEHNKNAKKILKFYEVRI